ncbi:glycoside hydrolase family 18 [Fusarium albosuccineum]|uniref:Glycoside hydrolase family 18 n=1 Tax=Fusarium albosuccineum TaxID=1237068 RepID=A0A8H4KXS4_9HYPO|nr:glycoside hydrolase family 18 [Fusarium albosuccineum]
MRTSGIILAAAAAVANAHYGEKDTVVYGEPANTPAPSYTKPHDGGFTTVYTHPVYPSGPSNDTTKYTTSTVYSTKTYTITQCPPAVTDCPIGHVTTETVPVYTTVCPVTEVHEPGKPGSPGKPGEPEYPHPTEPGKPHEPLPTNPADCITKTQTYVYPHPTNPGQSVTRTITYTVPKEPSHNATATYVPTKPTGAPPAPHNGTQPGYHGGKGPHGGKGNDEGYTGHESEGGNSGEAPEKSADRLPSRPTAEPDTVPTAGAAMNTVTGLLALAGFAAAYLI